MKTTTSAIIAELVRLRDIERQRQEHSRIDGVSSNYYGGKVAAFCEAITVIQNLETQSEGKEAKG